MRASRQEPFTTIKTVGGLLPADLLQRIAEGDREFDGLTPESYHLDKNERLNEAINRSWNRCVGAWWVFTAGTKSLPESDVGTTLTRERWLHIIFNELGYGRLPTSKAREINGKTYPISHGWQHTPIHFVSFRQDLDQRTPGVTGAAKMSPHSLIQEFLNRSQDHLWGIVSNGYRLRMLRDNVSLTRQAYVEFDIEGMMEGEVYSDFVLLFMLLHQSRVEAEKPEQCWLERWTQEAQQRGTRALDQLRDGVEKAIATLGQGFIAHPANANLRDKLQSGDLPTNGYYQQLLRLVYRMIFLFVAEDRDLLLLPEVSLEDRRRYLDHYSVTRIRRIAGRLRGTRHGDLWQCLKVTFRCLAEGAETMGLAPLGGFLFSEESLADLNNSQLANDELLEAIRYLSFTQENKLLRPVDYRNLGTEELGSVYESLLELHPEVNVSAYTFDLKLAAGSERKTTGSYYTPASLIKCLLDSALEPVIERAVKEPDSEKALLDLKVVDPACGSGHFLIAAAHRIAKHLAMVRTGESEPAPEERRRALRDVVRCCIYGVDVNPLAVELCKVALWIETLDPGRPLGFLDHQIKCGNSLIGATPVLLENGIPDDAFKPLEGDDKEVAKEIRKRNKQERLGQQDLYAPVEAVPDWKQAVAEFQHVVGLPEEEVRDVREKAALYKTVRDDSTFRHQRQIADLWTASFIWPLNRDTTPTVPTEDVFRRFQRGSHSLKQDVREQLEELATRHCFFHWHLEFPDVFHVPARVEMPDNKQRGLSGGFDVVLGNPPWDKIQPEEQKFFATIRPDIAKARTAAVRKKLISQLPEDDPATYQRWKYYKRTIDETSHLLKAGGCLPLTSRGNLNLYRLFSELASVLLSPNGQAGMVVQTGIATDQTSKDFLKFLFSEGRLLRFLDFENRKNYFPAIHASFRFALVTLGGTEVGNPEKMCEFGWFLGTMDELSEQDRLVHLTSQDLLLFSPTSGTCPVFTTQRDLEINRKIYKSGRHIYVTRDNRFSKIDFQGELFNMTRDADFFKSPDETTDNQCLPLYEAKLIHQFDHRFEGASGALGSDNKVDPDCRVNPNYVVNIEEVRARTRKQNIIRKWMCGFRSVSRATDERTTICTIFPYSAVGNSINLLLGLEPLEVTYLVANVNTYVFDYSCRQKFSGMNLNIWIMKQLPVIQIERYVETCSWSNTQLSEQIVRRVLELSYTAWDLTHFAQDCGYDGPPFRWNDNRRFLIRCELDAAYFHLYQVNRDDVDYIMETFPIVKRRDEQQYGDYRTKHVILKIYDDMQKAMETGQPYKTLLAPPPADPNVAHPPKDR